MTTRAWVLEYAKIRTVLQSNIYTSDARFGFSKKTDVSLLVAKTSPPHGENVEVGRGYDYRSQVSPCFVEVLSNVGHPACAT